jgi:signal transduction histidine kinase/CHASE2 domain-containing sensor protein
MRWLRGVRSRIWHVPSPSGSLLGFKLGIGCAFLVQAFLMLGWLDGLERGTLDALFATRGPGYGAPEIIIVVADDASVARYNSWPLPRRVYADLVRSLKRAGARTVAFDILFSESSPYPRDDRALATACLEAGNVVQGCAFHVEGNYNASLPVSTHAPAKPLAARFSMKRATSTPARAGLPTAIWASAALPELQRSAPLLGHLNIHPRADGAVRRIPHAIRYRNAIYPSLALAAAAHFLKVPAREIKVSVHEIRIAGRRLPFDERGETGINWAGGNGVFATFPITQVLDGLAPPEIFRDKIVLIGATAAGSFEYRATPFSSVQPAVEVQANALDNILENRPLIFADGWLRFGLLLVFAAVAGALIAPRLGLGGIALLLVLSAGMWLSAFWLLSSRHFYLPVAPALLAAAMTYASATALNYRREWEENFRADAAVAALARGGALMASGRNRARLTSVIRAAARDALRAEEIFFVRGATDDQTLNAIARCLSTRRHAVYAPFPRRASTAEKVFAPDEELAQLLEWLARRAINEKLTAPSIVAAPLPVQARREGEETSLLPMSGGALIAVGQREGRSFGLRDATLLETLAEQAALALENLEYYELLQGRVELANSDLREAYGVLSEQSAKFMAAVESIDDALVLCDAAGHAIFTNAGAAPTLREATPGLGENVPELLRERGLDSIAALFDCLALQKPGEVSDPARCEAVWPGDQNGESDAQPRVVSAQLTPLSTENGKLIGAMLLVADVTAQRQLDQMKTDFVSFVAHELRSPLGTILGYASLLQQYSDADPAMRDEMAGSIVRQCHRLNRLIGDLLDISRLEAGSPLDLRRERVELHSLAEKVLHAQRAALPNPRISLRLENSSPVIAAWGDPDRLEQILVNLVSNAVKYSPDGGEILLSLQDGDEGVLVRVRDEGIGMTREQVENLFQKYYRAPGARARGIKGTGLGLFLVKNLVEAHNGKIEVESEVGQGTTVSVHLPHRAAVAPDMLRSKGEENAPQATGQLEALPQIR